MIVFLESAVVSTRNDLRDHSAGIGRRGTTDLGGINVEKSFK